MDDISQFIYDHSNKELVPNEYFINTVFEILIDQYSLKQHIKNIIISNFNNNSLAYYSSDDKTIYINFCKFIYSIGLDLSRKMDTNSYEEKILGMNLFVLKVLLHELEHANQEKKMNNHFNDFEARIFRISSEREMYLKKSQLYNLNYNNLYFRNPMERQAELSALKETLMISKNLEQSILSNLIEREYLITSISDYQLNPPQLIYPIITYLDSWYKCDEIFDCINEIPLLASNRDLRLNLGLRISTDEYDELKENIRKNFRTNVKQ